MHTLGRLKEAGERSRVIVDGVLIVYSLHMEGVRVEGFNSSDRPQDDLPDSVGEIVSWPEIEFGNIDPLFATEDRVLKMLRTPVKRCEGG